MSISPFLLTIVALAACASAHFNLRSPMPYNPIDCNPPRCRGPCPPIWKMGKSKARNDRDHPSAIWKRGQKVKIQWHKNNHWGGFYRRSLVPVKHMFDADWHEKTAFNWGCWSQGLYHCGFEKECGTDLRGRGYENIMQVPDVLPDGDYVFSMTWFGGLNPQRTKSHFSNYFSCVFVKIQGGKRKDFYTPTFTPGHSEEFQQPEGKCLSGAEDLGECGGEECDDKPAKAGVPPGFRWGGSPPQLHRWLFNN